MSFEFVNSDCIRAFDRHGLPSILTGTPYYEINHVSPTHCILFLAYFTLFQIKLLLLMLFPICVSVFKSRTEEEVHPNVFKIVQNSSLISCK